VCVLIIIIVEKLPAHSRDSWVRRRVAISDASEGVCAAIVADDQQIRGDLAVGDGHHLPHQRNVRARGKRIDKSNLIATFWNSKRHRFNSGEGKPAAAKEPHGDRRRRPAA